MSIAEILVVPYWDVFPKKIKVSTSYWEQAIPLSIRGQLGDIPEFESADSSVSWVDEDGVVYAGSQVGATVIMIYDSWERNSVRYVQVEVIDGGGGY
jgi:hypothetical protein